ncbi:MAG: PspC domain-containing protein [Mediterranea sp.]|jgi:phage shock protein PspC (stress-responsive transcriptional regulator)|nr:PspC domain-containing protein [Mediterranea sp.]
MKKTLTVNLGGTVFHIDEDAYRLLDNYLNNLKHYFQKQKGADEIINDIENRISELFIEKVSTNTQVITIAYAEEVIRRVGSPEELTGEEEASKSNHKTTRQHLYRDPDNKMLGGVISGLAAYLGWDVKPLRLIFLILFFIGLFIGFGTPIIVYIICWLIIPKAKTAAEKLNMHGEEVTIENIGKTVTDGFEKVTRGVNNYMYSDKPRTLLQKLADILVSIIGFCLKACLIILAVIFSPVLLVLSIILIAFVFAFIVVAAGGGAWLYHTLPSVGWSCFSASPIFAIVACIAGIILVGVPLIGILHAIFKFVFNWQPMNIGLKWTLFFLWVVGLIVLIICLVGMRERLPYWENGFYLFRM